MECAKFATLQLLTTFNLKLLHMKANMTLGVAARGRHVPTVTCTYMVHAANLGESFDRLIDQQVTNLMVERLVDRDH